MQLKEAPGFLLSFDDFHLQGTRGVCVNDIIHKGPFYANGTLHKPKYHVH